MKELIESIDSAVAENGLATSKVDDSSAEDIYRQLRQKFSLNYEIAHQWECDNENKQVIDYSEDWGKLLSAALHTFSGEIVYLVVTDDEFYPWPMYKSRKDEVISLIEEQPYFEYFLFDEKMSQLVFDTHHDQIIIFK